MEKFQEKISKMEKDSSKILESVNELLKDQKKLKSILQETAEQLGYYTEKVAHEEQLKEELNLLCSLPAQTCQQFIQFDRYLHSTSFKNKVVCYLENVPKYYGVAGVLEKIIAKDAIGPEGVYAEGQETGVYKFENSVSYFVLKAVCGMNTIDDSKFHEAVVKWFKNQVSDNNRAEVCD